jgi:predicted metallopeptidase
MKGVIIFILNILYFYIGISKYMYNNFLLIQPYLIGYSFNKSRMIALLLTLKIFVNILTRFNLLYVIVIYLLRDLFVNISKERKTKIISHITIYFNIFK